MGTSNSYGGSGGAKPLIPTWLEDGSGSDGSQSSPLGDGDAGPTFPAPLPAPAASEIPIPMPAVLPSVDAGGGGAAPAPPDRPPIPPAGDSKRFASARNNFTRFVSSGGRDRRSLGRALSQYVSTSSGGSRNAARRMGVSRRATAQLAGVLSSAVGGNAREALRSIGLQRLVGRPIEEIFLGMLDIVCPAGGAIDDSIAREAFVETIVELAENGITDFDALTVGQVQTILELNIAHSIEARICNDIGSNAISLPQNVADAADI
jgi:hypothetical protein